MENSTLPIGTFVASKVARIPRKLRTASRLSGGVLVLAGAEMVLFGAPGGVIGATPATPLSVHQVVDQPAFGAPATVTMTVTAPSDHPAFGVVIVESLPACVSFSAGTVSPAPATATANPAPSPEAAGQCGPQSLLTISDLADLPAGASEQVSFEVTSTAALGTSLPLQASAFATDSHWRKVHLSALGTSVPAAASWLETSAPSKVVSEVSAYGVSETDSGLPLPSSPTATVGAVTDTITVSPGVGVTPSPVDVDVYLPAQVTLSGCPAASAGGNECLVPSVSDVTLPVDPNDPVVAQVPDLNPASAPTPLSASTPGTQPFSHLHWRLAAPGVGSPSSFSYVVDEPIAGTTSSQLADLVVVSAESPAPAPPASVDPNAGTTMPAQPPLPTAPPVYSQGAFVHGFTWQPPAPTPSTTVPTPTTVPAPTTVAAPATTLAPPTTSPASNAAPPSTPSAPGHAPAPLHLPSPATAAPAGPTGDRVGVNSVVPAEETQAQVTAASTATTQPSGRDPFLNGPAIPATPASSTPPATTRVVATAPQLSVPGLGSLTAVATNLAQTGINAKVQLMTGVDLIVAGGALVAFGGWRRRSEPPVD